MEAVAVFLLCVGIFVLCVRAEVCLSEGTVCASKASDLEDNNIPSMCKILNETISCMNTALTKCTSEEAKRNLNIGKMGIEQQYNVYCKETQPDGCSNYELAKCASGDQVPSQNVTLNAETCKTALKMKKCLTDVSDRCPSIKSSVDSLLTSAEQDIKKCEEILKAESGATSAYHWTGVVWFASLLVFSSALYV